METEPKPQRFQRNRRRERAYQLQQEKQGTQDASGDEGDESPPRTSKDKGRGKPRRRRNSSVEEDIIDGFAIVSFKSLEDLEASYKNTNGIRQPKPEKPNSRPPSPPKEKQKQIKKKYQKKNCSTAPSPTSDQPSPTVDHTRSPAPEDEEPQTNGPPRSISRDRLSDASTHSSSGQGYIPECESESEDDQVSESGSDLFTAVTVNHNRSSSERLAPTIPLTPPPPRQPTPPATTCNGTAVVTTTPSTTISVTTATTTTTTCSTPTTSPALTTTTICRPPSRPLVSPVLSRRPTPTPPPPPPRQSPLPPRQSPVPIPKQKLPPPPVVVPREPVKVTPPPVKTPRREDSAPHLHPHPHSHPHPHAPHPHQHQHQRDREREKEQREREQREREREREREISSHHNIFPGSLPFSKPSLWPSSVSNHLYSGHHPLPHSPSLHSPSLHPLHPHGPSFPPHSVAQSPIQHTTPPHPSHSMFAPPIPPGPPPLTSTALTPVAAPANHFANEPIIRNQDFLHQDLNNRILAHNRETSQPIGPTPYIRSETTHHQHQHLHNHQHMHQHYNALGPPPSLVPTPPPHLFDKIPKAYDSLYRPSLMPSPYPGFSSLLPPGPTANHLTSGLHGAFQPKVRSMQPSTSSVLLPLRDRDKPLPPSTSLPQQKKSGKWCAVHVRVAWEIYHHQQKQQSDPTKGMEVKPGDPLRPPSHLMPGPALHPRPPELGGGTPASLLGSHSRSLLEGHGSNSFLNPHLGVPSFPRPSPYPSSVGFGGLGSLGGLGGLGGSPFGSGRDVTAIPGVTPPHEWNRLHRTPPSFPSWPKLDIDRESERERELEREREREREQREREREREQRERDRERELNERRREEERERERRNAESRERLNSFVDIERSRERFKEHERRRSRSRSRSPMRNGRVDSAKSDTSSLERQSIKVKEERRDEEFINNINNMNAEREKLLRNNLVGLGHVPPTNPMVGFNMLERNRVLGPHYFPMDRPPHSQPLWNPFEKGLSMNPLDIDRERMAALRFPSPMAVIEQERLKEQIMREEMEMRSRYLDRIPSYDRFAFEQSKLPMRTPDPLGLPPFSRTISPAVNHSVHGGHSHHNHNHNHNHNHTGSKTASPAIIPGAPPPLIPSASATHSRSHNNSPTSSKSKGCSPADSTSELKDKRDTSSTDPDGHSR